MLNVVEGIRAAAAKNAFAPALITGTRVINYSDLLGLVARIGNDLTDRRIKRGAKLFLNIDDPDLRIITMVAAMHAGMVPLTLLQPGGDKKDIGYDLVVGVGAPFVRDLPCDLTIDQGVLVGPKGDPKLRDFPDRAADDILYVHSSSGTTGQRKMLAVTSSFLTPEDGVSVEFGAGDRIMITHGNMTAVAVMFSLWTMIRGATHVRVMPNLNDRLKLINLIGVTWLVTTPDALSEMMQVMDAVGVRCPSVQRVRISGSLLPLELVGRIERHFEAEIRVGYGSTEGGAIAQGILKSTTFEPGYVGEILSGVTVVTQGTPDNPQPLTIVKGRARPAAGFTAGKLVPVEGRPITLPDIGFLKGNSLFLVGRDDEVFNLDGNKVAYSVIERDLRRNDAVKDVAIVGGDGLGHPGQLFIAVVGQPAADLDALRAAVGKTLKAKADDRVRLFAIARIPRNPMGKVDRLAVVSAGLGHPAQA